MQLQIDIKKLNLGRNNISRYLKKLSNKEYRRLVRDQIKMYKFDSFPSHKQRNSTVFNEY